MSNILSPNQDGVQLFLPFSEGSGSVAYDYSENLAVETINGATYTKTSDGGYSLKFDANNKDYVQLQAKTGVVNTEGSLFIWINPKDLNVNRRLYDERTASKFQAYVSTANKILFRLRNLSDVLETIETDTLPLNSETLLTITWGSSDVKIYVNGEFLRSISFTGYLISANDTGLNLGSRRDSLVGSDDSSYFWNGTIRLPIILNKQVSGAFIKKLYQDTYIK